MVQTLKTFKTKIALGVVAAFALLGVAALPTASVSAASDYEYVGSFYWHESCEEAGRGGIPKAWSDYYCEGSGWPWDDYDLYVKYN